MNLLFLATNVPSKSLLGVRGIKGRVISEKQCSPQFGCILVRNFGILSPNSGEEQKKGLLQIGTVFGRNFGSP